MFEVELINQAQVLLEEYSRLWERRYKTKPILSSSGSDLVILKDLIRQLGLEKARSMIEAFLKSEHFNFIQKTHSLGSLKLNLNVVNAELARRQPVKASDSKGLMIQTYSRCGRGALCDGKYGKSFLLTVNTNELDAHYYKDLCPECDEKAEVP